MGQREEYRMMTERFNQRVMYVVAATFVVEDLPAKAPIPAIDVLVA